MVAPDPDAEVIAARIKAAFLAKKAVVEATGARYGYRTAAKNIAARNGTDPSISVESWRRQLQRILDAPAGTKPPKPHVMTRRLLAVEFGVDPVLFGAGDVPVVGGGTHFAPLFEALAEQERATKKLQRQVALFMERMEAVA